MTRNENQRTFDRVSWSRRRAFTAALAATTLAISLGGAVNSAQAAKPFDPLAIVTDHQLLASEETVSVSGGVQQRLAAEAQTESTVRPVSIAPLTDAASYTDNATGAVVHTADNHGFVTGTGTGGTNASFIVMEDASAPTEYAFAIDSPSSSLEVREDGTAFVLDDAGNIVNYFSAPWARDAEGRELPTHYTAEGNVLTQHIDASGATFPVVADPTSECGVGWCSVYFNRSETKAISDGTAQGGAYVAGGCALVNPILGAVCAIGVGVLAGTANVAYNDGNCLGINFSPVFGWAPFHEPRGTVHCP